MGLRVGDLLGMGKPGGSRVSHTVLGSVVSRFSWELEGGWWLIPKEGGCIGIMLLIGLTYLYLEEVLGDAVDLLKALGVR